MKERILIFLFVLLAGLCLGQTPIQTNADPDSIAATVGEIKTVEMVAKDTAIVTNSEEETFVLVGENIGEFIVSVVDGYNEIKGNVGEDAGVMDWLLEILKWLLGGGTLTSLITMATRTISGVKQLFSAIAKNIWVVVIIAGALSFGWQVVQGGEVMTMQFWTSWGVSWFAFTTFAAGIYETVIKNLLGKTANTDKENKHKIEKSVEFLKQNGASITFVS